MSPGLPEGVGAKVELEMMDQVHLFTRSLVPTVYCACTQGPEPIRSPSFSPPPPLLVLPALPGMR